ATAVHSGRGTKGVEEEIIYGRASITRSTRLDCATARQATDRAAAAFASEVHSRGAEDARRRSDFRPDEQNDRGADDYARAPPEVRQDREADPKILRARRGE